MSIKKIKIIRNVAVLGLILSYLAIVLLSNIDTPQMPKIELPSIFYPGFETAEL